jgi:hypothetical protein
MSELYAEPELTTEQELTLLRARIAIYIAQNDALRKEVEALKDKTITFAARVRQLEFEAMIGGGMRFAQRSAEPERMGRILPHDTAAERPKGGAGGKPGL